MRAVDLRTARISLEDSHEKEMKETEKRLDKFGDWLEEQELPEESFTKMLFDHTNLMDIQSTVIVNSNQIFDCITSLNEYTPRT